MKEQPEALRLDMMHHNAAVELRRLHAENEALTAANEQFGERQKWWNERMFVLETQRDALLEALDQCLNGTLIGGHTHNDNGLEVLAERCGSPHVAAELRRLAGIARTAIKAVEGEQA